MDWVSTIILLWFIILYILGMLAWDRHQQKRQRREHHAH